MPICMVLSVGLVIHIVLYPYSNHMNCSLCDVKNSMSSFRVLAVEDPEMEKLENVLAEGLPQS